METSKTVVVVTVYFYDNVVAGPPTWFVMHSTESVMRLLHNTLPVKNQPGTSVLFGVIKRCVPVKVQLVGKEQGSTALSWGDYIDREDGRCEVQIHGEISDEEIHHWVTVVAKRMRAEGIETSVWYTVEPKVFHHV